MALVGFPQWLLLMLLAGVLDVPHLFRILAATSAPTLPGGTHLLQAVGIAYLRWQALEFVFQIILCFFVSNVF